MRSLPCKIGQVDETVKFVFQSLKPRLGFSVADLAEKKMVNGLVLVLENFLCSAEHVNQFFLGQLFPFLETSQHEKPMLTLNGLRFFKSWLESGRKQQIEWYLEVQSFVQELNDSPARRDCLKTIEAELQRKNLVVGKWSADTDPLTWTAWDSGYVAEGLAALCGWFYDIRPYEFFEKRSIFSNLQMLRSASTAVSNHVAFVFEGFSSRSQTRRTYATEVAGGSRGIACHEELPYAFSGP